MTDSEKKVVEHLADPLYTVEFLEKWLERDDKMNINAPAALQAIAAKEYYRAVQNFVKLLNLDSKEARNVR